MNSKRTVLLPELSLVRPINIAVILSLNVWFVWFVWFTEIIDLWSQLIVVEVLFGKAFKQVKLSESSVDYKLPALTQSQLFANLNCDFRCQIIVFAPKNHDWVQPEVPGDDKMSKVIRETGPEPFAPGDHYLCLKAQQIITHSVCPTSLGPRSEFALSDNQSSVAVRTRTVIKYSIENAARRCVQWTLSAPVEWNSPPFYSSFVMTLLELSNDKSINQMRGW